MSNDILPDGTRIYRTEDGYILFGSSGVNDIGETANEQNWKNNFKYLAEQIEQKRSALVFVPTLESKKTRCELLMEWLADLLILPCIRRFHQRKKTLSYWIKHLPRSFIQLDPEEKILPEYANNCDDGVHPTVENYEALFPNSRINNQR